jgi:hypothetical protein
MEHVRASADADADALMLRMGLAPAPASKLNIDSASVEADSQMPKCSSATTSDVSAPAADTSLHALPPGFTYCNRCEDCVAHYRCLRLASEVTPRFCSCIPALRYLMNHNITGCPVDGKLSPTPTPLIPLLKLLSFHCSNSSHPAPHSALCQATCRT